MKTENLIKSISENLSPVRPLQNYVIRFAKWLGATLLCMGAIIPTLGLRHDISTALAEPRFLAELMMLISLALLSASAAFVLSVPNETKAKIVRIFPFIPLSIWTLILVFDFSKILSSDGMSAFVFDDGMACVGDIFVLGVVPGALLFIMLKKAAPTKLGWSGFLAVLAIASFGAIGSQLMCSNAQPMHLILWHLMPVVILGGAGVFIGRKLLRW